MQGRGEGASYTGQVERAVNKYYRNILENHASILIGDYNSPHIELPVDKPRIEYSLVDSFRNLGILSAYHEHFKVEYGKHNHHTFYQNRKNDFKHMLDYCFVSKSLIEKIANFEIGEYDDWMEFSDHCPLIIDFDFS